MCISRLLSALFLLGLALASRAPAYETYDDWRARYFTSAQLGAPLAADNGDANADGLPNLMHFAFGLSPWQSAPPGLTGAGVAPGVDGGNLVFYFPRRLAPGDIRYQPEFSRDLAAWWSGLNFFSQHVRQSIDTDMELVSVRAQSSLVIDGRQFFRLRVTRIDDSDGDGLDDAWEIEHFGDLSQGYYDDFDRDGVINGDAQWSGGDPRLGDAARDIAAPSWTEGGVLALAEETAAGFTLGWPEATDDKPGAMRYLVYRNNQPLGSAIAARSLAVSTADLAGWQRWHVRPVDQAGNIGDSSTVLERELTPVVDAAFTPATKSVATSLSGWGWKEFQTAAGQMARWYSKRTEHFEYKRSYLHYFDTNYRITHEIVIDRLAVTDRPVPDEETLSVTGTVINESISRESGVVMYHDKVEGTWSGAGAFLGTAQMLIPPEPSFTITEYLLPDVTGEPAYPDSTTQVIEEIRNNPISSPAEGHDRITGRITLSLSEEITDERLLAAAQAHLDPISEQVWGSQAAAASFYRDQGDATPPVVSLSEAEYKITIPTTEAGRRYRVRWLEVFYPEPPDEGQAPPPEARAYHEVILDGTGSAVESEVFTLAAPATEGSVGLVGVDIGLGAPPALAVNDNFDERLPDAETEWEIDAASPSPLREDGTVALNGLSPLWVGSNTVGGVARFGPETRGVRLIVAEGGSRIRLHALAPSGGGEDGAYAPADWREIASGEELWGSVFNRRDAGDEPLPEWSLHVEGLEPGKVVLRLEVDRFGEILATEKTLYVTRTELAARDPEDGETYAVGGLLEGGELRPKVVLEVDSAILNAGGDELTVQLSGHVSDPLSESLIDALLRVRSLAFEVNGRTVDGIADLPSLGGGELARPWQSANFVVPFSRTLRIPVRGPGAKIIRAVTAPGLPGARGWDEALVLLGREPDGDQPVAGPLPLRVLAVHHGEGTPAGLALPAVVRIDGLAEAPDDLSVAVAENGAERLLAPLSFSPRYFYLVVPDQLNQPTRYLVTLDDSVPVPPKESLRVIRAGAKHFALRVNDRIISEAVVQAAPLNTPSAHQPALPRAAETLNQVLTFHKCFFERPVPGDGGVQLGRILREAFEATDGLIQLVEGDEVETDTDSTGRLVISVGDELDPFSAAQGLFENLVQLSIHPTIQANLLGRGLGGDLFNSGRMVAIRTQGRALAAAGLEIYKAGLSLVSEGADWAIAVDEISEGNVSAALAFLPFVPAGAKKIIKHKRTGAVVAEFSDYSAGIIEAGVRAMKLDKIRGRLNAVRALRELRDAGYVDQKLIDAMVDSDHLIITDGSSRKQLKRVLGAPPSFFGLGHEAHHWIPLEIDIQRAALRRCVDPNEHGQWLPKTIHQQIHNVPVPGFIFKGQEFLGDTHNGFWREFLVQFPGASDSDFLEFAEYLKNTVYKL